ncbi:MAG TPA: lysophospholipid acyltransferase family protein [Trebonia sp.]|nr:lysophospholipid acyltransferase family protein [Trebonia sp.]
MLFRPKVTGLEHIPQQGGAVLAANHVSFLDPLLLPLVVPRRILFLTKVKYIDNPVLHWVLTGAGVIPVASDDPQALTAVVAACVAALSEGRLVGVFPEGTRSRDGLLHQGKTGIARMAVAAGVPVIPAGITGTELALPRGALLPRPHVVHITFGPPITLHAPADMPADAAASRAATDQVMTAIAALSGQKIAALTTLVSQPPSPVRYALVLR